MSGAGRTAQSASHTSRHSYDRGGSASTPRRRRRRPHTARRLPSCPPLSFGRRGELNGRAPASVPLPMVSHRDAWPSARPPGAALATPSSRQPDRARGASRNVQRDRADRGSRTLEIGRIRSSRARSWSLRDCLRRVSHRRACGLIVRGIRRATGTAGGGSGSPGNPRATYLPSRMAAGMATLGQASRCKTRLGVAVDTLRPAGAHSRLSTISLARDHCAGGTMR
jgi:hypothetical protein